MDVFSSLSLHIRAKKGGSLFCQGNEVQFLEKRAHLFKHLTSSIAGGQESRHLFTPTVFFPEKSAPERVNTPSLASLGGKKSIFRRFSPAIKPEEFTPPPSRRPFDFFSEAFFNPR